MGKETWYKVSSYKDGEESNKVKLGSVTPLDTFNVRLISPKDKALDVSVQPTFVWEPTKKLISSESELNIITQWLFMTLYKVQIIYILLL